MARSITILFLVAALATTFPGVAYLRETPAPLTAEQQELVDHALERFAAQGLELPSIDFVFRSDAVTCNGFKGRYYRKTATLEMCSMDPITMLHELAHAWANQNLTDASRAEFVESRGLDGWNDHDDPWERRGTEHVAETIAWALAEDPHHVKWVETGDDGSSFTTHRILTVNVDVDTLLHDFRYLTGMDPVFRHPDEWALEEPGSNVESPERTRFGGWGVDHGTERP